MSSSAAVDTCQHASMQQAPLQRRHALHVGVGQGTLELAGGQHAQLNCSGALCGHARLRNLPYMLIMCRVGAAALSAQWCL